MSASPVGSPNRPMSPVSPFSGPSAAQGGSQGPATAAAAAKLANVSLTPPLAVPTTKPIAPQDKQLGLIKAYWDDANGNANKPLKKQTVAWVLCQLHGFKTEQDLCKELRNIAQKNKYEPAKFKKNMDEFLQRGCNPSAASQGIIKIKEEDGSISHEILATYSPKPTGKNKLDKGWMFQAANGSMNEESIEECKLRELIEELAANGVESPVMDALLNTQGVRTGGKLADLNAVASAINAGKKWSLYYNIATLSGNVEPISRADVDAFMKAINNRIMENKKFYKPACDFLFDDEGKKNFEKDQTKAKELVSKFLENDICQATILPAQWDLCFSKFNENPTGADLVLTKQCLHEMVDLTETSKASLVSSTKYQEIVQQHQKAHEAKLKGDETLINNFENSGFNGERVFDAGFAFAHPALENTEGEQNSFLERCAAQYWKLPASNN